MAEPVLRRMTLSDVPAVHRLEEAIFSMPWSEKDFVYEMTENKVARYLVIEEAGEIIAFAGAHIILDQAHVTNIAVRQDCRGRGLGRMITRELMQYASNLGAEYLTLEVRQSNARALQVYERYGFVRVGLRKDYYPADRQQREHAVVMSLKL